MNCFQSAFLRLSKSDLFKGCVVAALTAALSVAGPAIAAGAITTAIMTNAGYAGLAGGIAYLTKNLFTNSEGKMLAAEPPKQ